MGEHLDSLTIPFLLKEQEKMKEEWEKFSSIKPSSLLLFMVKEDNLCQMKYDMMRLDSAADVSKILSTYVAAQSVIFNLYEIFETYFATQS